MKRSLTKYTPQSWLIILMVVGSIGNLYAQDGVLIDYAPVPALRNGSAVMELRSSNQGFLAPQVALTATNLAAPISTPAIGLMVYNTATAGDVTPGYYYWEGSWKRFISNLGGIPTGSGTTDYLARWTSATTLGVGATQDNGLRVGIAAAPHASYALQVGGDVLLTTGAWLRTTGNTGWLNETHAGGWYMTDATWIRTYNGKSIYQNSGIMRTDGTLQVGSSGATLNVPSGGNFSYRTNVLFANTAGNVGIGNAGPTYKLDVTGDINTTTGYRVAGAAATGTYLRGNGSQFVGATIPYTDITGTPTALPPSGTAGGDLSGSYPNPQVIDDSHNHTELEKKPNYSWNAATNARDYPDALATSFVRASDGFPEYGSVLHMRTYDDDGGTMQLYAPYSPTYGGNALRYRLGLYNNAGWTGWRTIWDDNNDGAGSGMDADLLDGQNGTYYLDNTDAQTLSVGGGNLTISNGNSVALSSLGDNLGNHTATQNVKLNGYWLSNDGGNEGLRVDNSGNVGIGTASPGATLEVNGSVTIGTGNYVHRLVHGTNSRLLLPAANNGASSGDVNFVWWASEPGMTWTGAGIARNMYNTTSWPRINTALTGQMMRFDEGTGIIFTTETSGGVRQTPLTLSGNDATVGGNATVTGLAGTGNRPVYADASGTLTTSSADANTTWTLAQHGQSSPDDIGFGWTSSVDDSYTGATMPFSININGTAYSALTLNTNGTIVFGSTTAYVGYGYSSIPSSVTSLPFLAWYWRDMVTRFRYGSVGTAPNRVYIIDFDSNAYNTGDDVDGQVQIHETSGLINVYYRVMDPPVNGQNGIIGFQLNGGSSAKTYPITSNGKTFDDNALPQSWSVCPVR